MIDGSSCLYAEHCLDPPGAGRSRAVGVSVEAELGKIGGTEDDITVANRMLYRPEEAGVFVNETGVDSWLWPSALPTVVQTPNWIFPAWKR